MTGVQTCALPIYRARLHLLDTDHRMYDQLQTINYFFEHFLVAIDMQFGYR